MGASGTHTRRSCRLFQEVRCHEALHHARGREDCRRRWRAVAAPRWPSPPVLAKRHRVRATCKPFYSEATRHFKIPDINHGFVPQDLFYLDDEKTWLFSGYMANRKPSPIFQVGEGGEVRRHEVRLPDGSLYRGHGAAITAPVLTSSLPCATASWFSTVPPWPPQPTAIPLRPPAAGHSP